MRNELMFNLMAAFCSTGQSRLDHRAQKHSCSICSVVFKSEIIEFFICLYFLPSLNRKLRNTDLNTISCATTSPFSNPSLITRERSTNAFWRSSGSVTLQMYAVYIAVIV